MKFSKRQIRFPASQLEAVANELHSETIASLAAEFKRLERKLYQAYLYQNRVQQYWHRVDRRKARHQKRNELRKSIEDMHDDFFEDLPEIAEQEAWRISWEESEYERAHEQYLKNMMDEADREQEAEELRRLMDSSCYSEYDDCW